VGAVSLPPSHQLLAASPSTPVEFAVYQHARGPSGRILVNETERMVHVAQTSGEQGPGPLPVR